MSSNDPRLREIGAAIAENSGVFRAGVIAALMVLAMVLAIPAIPAASAGRLGKVVNGLKHRSGQTDNNNNASGSSDKDSSDDDSSNSSHSSDGGSGWGHNGSGAFSPMLTGGYPYLTGTKGSDVQMYFGMMSVFESDGAMRGSIRASSDNYGIGLDGTRYFEQTRTASGTAYLHLDVWSLNGQYRALKMGNDSRTAVWLHAGLAGQSSDGLHLLGVTIGAEIAHNLNAAVGLEASARAFAMQDDIRAMEVRAGVAASVLRVSYRVLKFNVGPALRGPEVGVAWRF